MKPTRCNGLRQQVAPRNNTIDSGNTVVVPWNCDSVCFFGGRQERGVNVEREPVY